MQPHGLLNLYAVRRPRACSSPSTTAAPSVYASISPHSNWLPSTSRAGFGRFRMLPAQPAKQVSQLRHFDGVGNQQRHRCRPARRG